MGAGDIFTIASAIDTNWLWRSLTEYTWSFFAMVFLVFVFGFLIGMTIQYVRLSKRLKNEEKLKDDLNSCNGKNANLEEKVRSLSDETSSLKEKIRKIENPKLTKEELTEYVSKFPDAQKDILAEIYEAGGSIEAEALDSALMTLASAGLISVPPLMAPGTYCVWSLTPEVNALISANPSIVESKRAKKLRKQQEQKRELSRHIRHLDHEAKMVLWVVYESDNKGFALKEYDSVHSDENRYKANIILAEFENKNLVDYEYIDTHTRKWSMTDLGKELVEENLDTFKYVKDDLKKER